IPKRHLLLVFDVVPRVAWVQSITKAKHFIRAEIRDSEPDFQIVVARTQKNRLAEVAVNRIGSNDGERLDSGFERQYFFCHRWRMEIIDSLKAAKVHSAINGPEPSVRMEKLRLHIFRAAVIGKSSINLADTEKPIFRRALEITQRIGEQVGYPFIPQLRKYALDTSTVLFIGETVNTMLRTQVKAVAIFQHGKNTQRLVANIQHVP